MGRIVNPIAGFVRRDEGATLVEYGIAIVLAVAVGTTALVSLGGQINANMVAATTELARR